MLMMPIIPPIAALDGLMKAQKEKAEARSRTFYITGGEPKPEPYIPAPSYRPRPSYHSSQYDYSISPNTMLLGAFGLALFGD